jgi:kynurenine formamidase
MERVGVEVSRRRFLGMLGAAAVAGAAAGPRAARASAPALPDLRAGFRVRDLTHTAGPDFPVFPGNPQMKITTVVTVQKDGFYANVLEVHEHTGTHMDAPAHFDVDGATADELEPERFFAPLAIVDISERAAGDPDAQVEPDDLEAWERRHGRLPEGAFVAMHSAWERRLPDAERFINADAAGVPHFPGWSPEAAELLVGERDIVGIGVDTVSLDFGASKDFKTHLTVLSAGKYGLESLANLGHVPPSGAMIFVGGPKHERASGGPTRAFALHGPDVPGAMPGTGGGGTAR